MAAFSNTAAADKIVGKRLARREESLVDVIDIAGCSYYPEGTENDKKWAVRLI